MTAGVQDLTIEQGATLSQVYSISLAGVAFNLTGYTARMKVRPFFASSDVLINLTTENGGITNGGAGGTLTLNMSATATAALNFTGNAKYDIEIASGSGVVTRIVQGNCHLSQEVTY